MKATIKEVTIADPCTQNWDEMEKGAGFNFCKACSKNVIDFSGYTNAEIIRVLSNASGTSICGRLSQTQLTQLNYHLAIVPATNRNWMKYLGVLAIGASIFIHDAKAETFKKPVEIVKSINNNIDDKKPTTVKKVYGYVLDANNKPAEGIRLVIAGTKLFATTDKDGRYEFKLDAQFDTKNNQLVVESVRYAAILNLNFAKEKQNNLKLNKADQMIMGKIMLTPKKS